MNSSDVKKIALARGAAAAGVAPTADIAEFRRYDEAVTLIPDGLSYLKRDPLVRKNIKKWFPAAKAALVCAFRYWEPGRDRAAEQAKAGPPLEYLKASGRRPNQPQLLVKPGAKISRYALCSDYHVTVKEKLAAMLADIKAAEPSAEGKTFCDTSPVMEKELARQAGLGWRGKNTLLLSREHGSYIFLGGIALNLPLEPDEPAADGCGTCSQCENACPTRALRGGRLDPERCLAYWNTQAKTIIPKEAAARAGGWAYGCDACQEACPVNNHIYKN